MGGFQSKDMCCLRRSDKSSANPQPIRLIDVLSTIKGSDQGKIFFKAGTEIGQEYDFHVISHTWSEDVRSLSERIGKQVRNACSPEAYNKAFEKEDFSSVDSYKKLIDFLRLLVPEGVKLIWFDALCINQKDSNEKSKEISNMGAYYGLSRGCYVISHGLGMGYQLWTSDRMALPRWFSRAWTFQEFLLPRKLTFIVEGLDHRLIAFINWQISEKGKESLCKCLLQKMKESEDALWGSASNLDVWEFVVNKSRSKIWESISSSDHVREELKVSDVPCEQCKSLPLVRKAQHDNSATKQLYFVDREAYLGVMQFEGIFLPRQKNPSLVQAVTKLSFLYNMLNERCFHKGKPTWNARYTIAEVRQRDCSVEEDRVLSMLGLLGLQISQLRTGQGLRKQMVQLAKACDEEMLVALCLFDAKPSSIPGMSWMPELTRSSSDSIHWHSINMRAGRPEVDVEVQKLHVSDTGCIKLLAKVLSGMVLPATSLPMELKEAETFKDCYLDGSKSPTHFIVVPKANENKPFELDLLAKISMESCCFFPLDVETNNPPPLDNLPLDFKLNWRATESGHVGQLQTNSEYLSMVFPVHLVILGTGEQSDHGNLLSSVMMICINAHGVEEHVLQKVGLLSIAEQTDDQHQEKTFKKAERRICFIGGLEANRSLSLCCF